MSDLIPKNTEYDDNASNFLYSAMVECFKKDFDNAINFLEEAEKLFLESDDTLNIALCNAELAIVQYEKLNSNLKNSYLLLSKATEILEKVPVKSSITEAEARITHYYGKLKYYEKQFTDSLIFYIKALKQADNNGLEYAKILDSLAIFYFRLNYQQFSLRYLYESLAIKRKLNNKTELAYTEFVLGRYLLSIENYESASIHLNTALVLSEEVGLSCFNSRIFEELSKIHIYIEDLHTAEKFCEKAIQAAISNKNDTELAFCQTTYAYILALKKSNDKAKETIIKARKLFYTLNLHRGNAFLDQINGIISLNTGNTDEAVDKFNSSIEKFKNLGINKEIAKNYLYLATAHKQVNNIQSSLTCILEAMKITKANNYQVLTNKIEALLFELTDKELSEVPHLTNIYNEAYFTDSSLFTDDPLFSNILTYKQTSDPLLSLLRIGKAIYTEYDQDKILEIAAAETQNSLSADRCSIFLYDKNTNELYSRIAAGVKNQEIRFPANLGLAGYVFITGEIVKIDDAYNDPLFNKVIDEKTGYKTKNILCIPIRDSNQEIIGVFEVINKLNEESFTDNDIELLISIGSSVGKSLETVNLLQKQSLMIEDQKRSFKSFINTLAASIDARDKITAGHSTRVTAYALVIADQLDLPQKEREVLEYAAILHDIGKLGIRDEVLCKEGKLSDEEYKHIQEHSKITYEILNKMYFEEKLKDVPEIAAFHHEKFNGQGYYKGLAGNNIPFGSRIIAVADVFDAITSKRHYRDRMPFGKVLEILKNDAGLHFDKEIIDKFFEINLSMIVRILISRAECPLTAAEMDILSQYNINDIYLSLNKEETALLKEEQSLVDLFLRHYDGKIS